MNSAEQIYLDYAATTPVDERVLRAMMPFFQEQFGNPSSIHRWGQSAETALDQARMKIAILLNSRPEEIVFTSCGTESDNLALRGTARARRALNGANRILITPVEHHAVFHTAQQLKEQEGFELQFLPVDSYGRVDVKLAEGMIGQDTAIVSAIYANNEIGTVNPVEKIGEICREKGVPFHSDAVQAAAHLKMDVRRDHLDLLSLGAHKFYGPKGVGALFVRNGTPISAVQTGGGQENGLRAGTQNVALIAGMAEGLRFAQAGWEERARHYQTLRDHLIGSVLENIPASRLSGHPSERLPNHASFVFEGVDGNHLLMMLDVAGFACSSGSACKTGSPKPSEVLTAVGFSPEWALGSLRVTMGIGTTAEQVRAFEEALPGLVQRQRQLRGWQA